MIFRKTIPYVLTVGILAYGFGGGADTFGTFWPNGDAAEDRIEIAEGALSNASDELAEISTSLKLLQELQEANGQISQLSSAYGMMEQMFEESQTELAVAKLESETQVSQLRNSYDMMEQMFEDSQTELTRLELELSEVSQGQGCYEQLRDNSGDYTVFFGPSSTTLENEEVQKIVILGEQLRDCPNVVVQVTGHSDSVGDDAFNILLSWQRADAVVSIMDAVGIDTRDVASLGFGARTPLAEGDLDDDLDRRVEFQFLPKF